jgi:enolase
VKEREVATTIIRLTPREILDSRGRPTVEVDLHLSNGSQVTASVPSGASTGRHEAVELRDGDPAHYAGLGVQNAVASIGETIAPDVVGSEPDVAAIDKLLIELDGTPDKSRLGANALLAVSLATAKAQALCEGVPLWRHFAEGGPEVRLPMPMVNIISGGLHAGRQMDFQDLLVIPCGATSFSEALAMTAAVHRSLGAILPERGLSALRADEGGYGPSLPDHGAALSLLDEAVERAGYALGEDIVYAVDVAATHFADTARKTYRLASEDRELDAHGLGKYLIELCRRHPIVSLEDPFAEDDWAAWNPFAHAWGERLQILGDDLFTTNLSRVTRGVQEGSANAVLVKMNQIGTISETLAVISAAKQAQFRTVISARSGETEDPALADLAVGTDGGQIKIGSVTGSERLAKYNQLLRIEETLGSQAELAAFDLRPLDG